MENEQTEPTTVGEKEIEMVDPLENEAVDSEKEDDKNANARDGMEKKRRSHVWDEMKLVNLPSGETKAKCSHCTKYLKLSTTGSTSTLRRHLQGCVKRAQSEKGQPQIQFQPILEEEGGTSITNFKYEKEKTRKVLAKMIIADEKPFAFVESRLFNLFCRTLQPRHVPISRYTIKRDCMTIYKEEKEKVQEEMDAVKVVCLTTDTWTSRRSKSYMSLTAHYVDSSWKIQKRVLCFRYCPPPHSSQALANMMTQFIHEWALEGKVLTITLDNALANDNMMAILKMNFISANTLCLTEIFHVRCCAHILNLIVKDGLKHIKDLTNTVRETVKYVKSSFARKVEFESILAQMGLSGKKELILDVSTRWNSTYLMLKAAREVKVAFSIYADTDSNYRWCPSEHEWKKYEDLEELLEKFYQATEILSASRSPTSNLFLPVIWRIKNCLSKELEPRKEYMKDMIEAMKEKFDKYWSDCNFILGIATILDPRSKKTIVEFCYPMVYKNEGVKELEDLQRALENIFLLYDMERKGNSLEDPPQDAFVATPSSFNLFDDEAYIKFVEKLEQKKVSLKSELDIYLEEPTIKIAKDVEFDILHYWKSNAVKFKTLSILARDILSIPMSSVASESAFSTGERLISEHRSSLKSETVEALLCSQDWLRSIYNVKSLEEDIEEDEPEGSKAIAEAKKRKHK